MQHWESYSLAHHIDLVKLYQTSEGEPVVYKLDVTKVRAKSLRLKLISRIESFPTFATNTTPKKSTTQAKDRYQSVDRFQRQ
ncbi:hypothetical protein N805_08665 [Pseudomonas putida S13.1.2]|uniref:Uncharacterized protein n=1 Tax=Pseudomonas putida S13.1.2 TaxID=1384061 RepID=A0AAU8RW06_PSEPU|nr:hypothetical protein N805_08665 [Pseudomonas putida S13.1.2]